MGLHCDELWGESLTVSCFMSWQYTSSRIAGVSMAMAITSAASELGEGLDLSPQNPRIDLCTRTAIFGSGCSSIVSDVTTGLLVHRSIDSASSSRLRAANEQWAGGGEGGGLGVVSDGWGGSTPDPPKS